MSHQDTEMTLLSVIVLDIMKQVCLWEEM